MVLGLGKRQSEAVQGTRVLRVFRESGLIYVYRFRFDIENKGISGQYGLEGFLIDGGVEFDILEPCIDDKEIRLGLDLPFDGEEFVALILGVALDGAD